MHRCLQIPEILRIILDDIGQPRMPDQSFSQRTNLRTYAAMAQTCKLFYEPSMDILWTTLHSVDPLMGCLPDPIIKGTSTAQNELDFKVRFYP